MKDQQQPSRDDNDITVHFRVGELRTPIEARMTPNVSAHGVAKRDLARYYYLLEIGRRLIRQRFTEEEIIFFLDAMNGSIYREPSAPLEVKADIDVALFYSDLSRWSFDASGMSRKLDETSLIEWSALHDAVERFWSDRYHVQSTHTRLIEVGLVAQPTLREEVDHG